MSVLNTDHRSASYIRYEVGDRDSRPWGTWEVLATGDRYTVKRISVLPGHRLSLQYHQHRSEHWTIVQGLAEVELDDVVHLMSPGEHVHIPVGALHRVRALGSERLAFLEIQVGEILDENDIIRISDDYGRLKPETARESSASVLLNSCLMETEESMWPHYCVRDRSWFCVAAGGECNWCGKRQSDPDQVERAQATFGHRASSLVTNGTRGPEPRIGTAEPDQWHWGDAS